MVIGRVLHPRRLWLWIVNNNEIDYNSTKLLPKAYSIKDLVYIYRPELTKINLDDVLNELKQSQVAAQPIANTSKIDEVVLTGAEGMLLYGQDFIGQLRDLDSNLPHLIVQGLKATLSNTANLNVCLSSIQGLAEHNIPQALLPLAQPLILHCLNKSQDWFHENILDTGQHAGNLASSALDLNHDAISTGVETLHDAWLHPAGSITSDPVDLITQHFESVDTAGHAGDLITHVADHADIADHLSNHADIGLHVPWVTMLRSGHREIELLKNGKTDILTSSKNIALDSATVMAGAKAGGAAGFMVGGPVGAAVGAVFGGIVGKLAGNEVKQLPLNNAIKSHDEYLLQFDRTHAHLNSEITLEFNNKKEKEQFALELEAQKIGEDITQVSIEYSEWFQSKRLLANNEANELITVALNEIDNAILELTQKLKEFKSFSIYMWPTVEIESIRLSISVCNSRKRKLIKVLNKINLNQQVTAAKLFDELASYGLAENVVRQILAESELNRKERENAFIDTLSHKQKVMLEKRAQSVERLDSLLKELALKIETTIKPMAESLNEHRAKVHSERQKLGLA